MSLSDKINELTIEQKIILQTGKDILRTAKIAEIPQAMMVDGPHGLRLCENGKTTPQVAFPSLSTIANSWNREAVWKMGEAIARQCQKQTVALLLAPGVNIKRHVLCGRNFEYFSEDPFLAGELGAAYVMGVQSTGIGACVKHFAANNQESGRLATNSVIDEKALREIYLAPFERVIKKAKPWAVMCSYNALNGEYSSQNKKLLTDILRKEWDYEGLTISDWWSVDDRIESIKAGLDLEMPRGETRKLLNAVKENKLAEAELDTCCRHILDFLEKADKITQTKIDPDGQKKVAAEVAAESVVLLKNDGILPFTDDHIVVVGSYADTCRIGGKGSSEVKPLQKDSVIKQLKSAGKSFEYYPGYIINSEKTNRRYESEAINNSKGKTVLFFMADPDLSEAESYDRENMSLPLCQLRLLNKLSLVAKNIVVVLQCGAPVDCAWSKMANAILLQGLAGEYGSEGLTKILYGELSPSGKLAETWPLTIGSQASDSDFAQKKRNVFYKESIYVGYRYFDSARIRIAFPFGFGLSYTKFQLTEMELSKNTIQKNEGLNISVTLTNTGRYDGSEVLQAYVKKLGKGIFHPEKELKGFVKAFLKKGETKTVEIALEPDAFRYFDPDKNQWETDKGYYDIIVSDGCSTSIAKRLEIISGAISSDQSAILPHYYDPSSGLASDQEFSILYKQPLPKEHKPKEPHTRNSMLMETKDRAFGRFVNLIVGFLIFCGKMMKNEFAMIAGRVLPMSPIRSILTMTKKFDMDMVDCLVEMFDGHVIKGYSHLCKERKKRKNEEIFGD